MNFAEQFWARDQRTAAHRLSAEQRHDIPLIFAGKTAGLNIDVAKEFVVSNSLVSQSRKQLAETKNKKHLTGKQLHDLSRIFAEDPRRRSSSIAEEFNVSRQNIALLRRQFTATGNLERGGRLTAERRQEILHIFAHDPTRSDMDIAHQFRIPRPRVSGLRQRFEAKSVGETSRRPADQEQETGSILAGSSKTASDGKNPQQPASTSVDAEYACIQKRACIDSARLHAEQVAGQAGSAGIRIFGVQLYPEKIARHSQDNNKHD